MTSYNGENLHGNLFRSQAKKERKKVIVLSKSLGETTTDRLSITRAPQILQIHIGKFRSFESESRLSRPGNNVSPFCEPCTWTIYTNDTITRAESSNPRSPEREIERRVPTIETRLNASRSETVFLTARRIIGRQWQIRLAIQQPPQFRTPPSLTSLICILYSLL